MKSSFPMAFARRWLGSASARQGTLGSCWGLLSIRMGLGCGIGGVVVPSFGFL